MDYKLPVDATNVSIAVAIIAFLGWILREIIKAFLPKLSDAWLGKIQKETELAQATKETVVKIPEMIAGIKDGVRDGMREGLSGLETRLSAKIDASNASLKEEIFSDDRRQILDKLSSKDVPTPPPSKTP